MCSQILAISQQRDALGLVALVAAGLLLLFGDSRWHPLLLFPLSSALAILAGGPPVCELVLLRTAVGIFGTLILLLQRGASAKLDWRTRLSSLTMRALGLALAAMAATSLLEISSPPTGDRMLWQTLAGCGTLSFVHTLASRDARGIAAGTVAMLLVLDAATWLLRPSLLVLAGCGALALLVALGGSLHQDARATAEDTVA
ncbi:MAG: hypothetical protein ACP5G7_01830 [Anaerolineae bacterium]